MPAPRQPWFKLDGMTILGLALILVGAIAGTVLYLNLPTLHTGTGGVAGGRFYYPGGVVEGAVAEQQYLGQLTLARLLGFGGVLAGALLVLLVAPVTRRGR